MSAVVTTILGSKKRCSQCGRTLYPGMKVKWYHYYGKRPSEFAHLHCRARPIRKTAAIREGEVDDD